jgi:hypothetical protein
MRAILLVCLVACGSAQRPEPLGDAVRSYNEGVRWERFSMAAAHLPPAERGTWVDESDERAKDLKITDYDIVKIEPRGDREAKVQVKLSWYKESEGVVRETHATQTWERHGKAWLMVDEARLRGPEMPGLPEPLEKDAVREPLMKQ